MQLRSEITHYVHRVFSISILFFILFILCVPVNSFSQSNNYDHHITLKKTVINYHSIITNNPLGQANIEIQSNGPKPINNQYNYSDVLMVYNEASALSTRIAQYFQNARNIPNKNMCNITTSTSETVNRAEFENIRAAIENHLENNNLTNSTKYIVTTKGVPLRVSGTTNVRACLDSELTMILGNNKNGIGNSGWVINPYFEDDEPFTREKYSLYLVTRLTAFTEAEIYNIIDNATISTGNRGTYVLDVDASKGFTGGYGVGNVWLRNANTILTNKGEPTNYDNTNTYIKSGTNIMGYSSWGSNDAHDTANFVTNYNMESVSGSLPNNWYPIHDPGILDNISISTSDKWSGSYSIMMNRTNSSANYSAIAQNITITPGMRYYIRGYVNISSISGSGGAHLQLQALDSNNNILNIQNSQVWTTVNSAWTYLRQLIYEPVPGAVKVRVLAIFNRSEGEAYFDDIRLFDIPPHFTWIPGSIAETFVSTGARSFRYGTSYGQSLVADLLRDGVTGVKGYVYEPYLSAIAHPDILYDRYTDGYNLAESYYMASNFIGWMDVVVGDPKMAPYADTLPDLNISSEGVIYSPGMPNQFKELSINVTVSNIGSKTVTNPVVKVYLVTEAENKLIDERSIPNLIGNGGSANIKINYIPTITGSMTLEVIVDPENMFKETNESNNQVIKPIYINNPPNAIGLTALNETIYRGEVAQFSANGTDIESNNADLKPHLEWKFEPHGSWKDFDDEQINYSYNLETSQWDIHVISNITMELGKYSFRLSFTDENALTSNFYNLDKALEVINNNPNLVNINLNTTEIYRSKSVNITCHVYDRENSHLNLTILLDYRLKVDGMNEESGWKSITDLDFDPSNDLWFIIYTFDTSEEPGIYQFRAKVIDKDSDESNWSISGTELTLLNNLPYVNEINITSSEVKRTDRVELFIYGDDLENHYQLWYLTCELEYSIASSPSGQWMSQYLSDVDFKSLENGWVATYTPPKNTILGTYKFRSRLMDRDGEWSQWYGSNDTLIVANNYPEADQSKIPEVAKEDETITIKGTDSEDVEDDSVSFYWSINTTPETTSTNDSISISFTKKGVYEISLKVIDSDGAEAWENNTITIENIDPEAKIDFKFKTYYPDDMLYFSGENSTDSSSDIGDLKFHWDFGDGTEMNGVLANNSYTEPGKYTVILTVTDNDGKSDEKILLITIYPNNDQPPEVTTPDDEVDVSNSQFFIFFVIIAIIIFVIIILFIVLRKKKKQQDESDEPVQYGIAPTIKPQQRLDVFTQQMVESQTMTQSPNSTYPPMPEGAPTIKSDLGLPQKTGLQGEQPQAPGSPSAGLIQEPKMPALGKPNSIQQPQLPPPTAMDPENATPDAEEGPVSLGEITEAEKKPQEPLPLPQQQDLDSLQHEMALNEDIENLEKELSEKPVEDHDIHLPLDIEEPDVTEKTPEKKTGDDKVVDSQ